MLPTSQNIALVQSSPAIKAVRPGFLCRAEWQIFYPDTDENKTNQLIESGKIEFTDTVTTLTCDCGNKHVLEIILPWMIGTCNSVHNREYTPELRAKMGQNGKNQTGPKTVKGKFICSMNGLKHGALAKKHIFPRAEHDNLAICNGCPFFDRCGSEKWQICELQMPNIADFINAHNGDGASAISGLIGDVQARTAFLLTHSLDRAIREGVTVKRKTTKSYGKGEKAATEETEWEELSPVIVATGILAKNLGGVGLNDWKLTPQSARQAETQASLASLIEQITQPFRPQLPA